MRKIYLISVLILLIGASFGLITYAFTGPSASPPNGNPDFWVKPGSIMYYTGGNVGIGQTTATDKLEVTGNIKASGTVGSGASGLCINGDCRTSWASVSSPSGWTDGGTSVYLTTATDNVGVGTGTVDANYKITTANGGVKAESTTQPAGYFNSTSGYGLVVNTGNVGIGTTAPVGRLQIVASTGRQIISGSWSDMSGSASGYGLFGGNMYQNASPQAFKYSNTHANIGAIGFATNYPSWNKASVISSGTTSATSGTDFTPSVIATFDYAGNVGVGTTAPSQKLEVVGNVSSTALCLGGVCNTTWPSGLAGGGTVNYISKFTGTGTLGNSLLFDNGTNVGIGTTSPENKLHVYQGNTNTGYLGGMTIEQGSTGDASLSFLLTAVRRWNMGIKNSDNDKFYINQDNGGAFNSNGIVIDISGNVGIGTTAPVSKLSVGGAGIASTGVYGTGASYGVYGEGSTGVDGVGTSFGVEGTGTGTNATGVLGTGAGTGKGVYGNGGGYGVYGSGTIAGVYGINSGGNGVYGIGSTGVYGSGTGTNSNGVYGAGDTYGVYGYSGGTAGVYGMGGTYGVKGSGTTADFYAVHTGSGTAAGGAAYASASSIRWKENIIPIPDALGKIMLLNGVYFDWKKDYGGQHDMGMIAEDVRKVIPEIVAADPDSPGYDIGLDYSRLTPVLVEAVKSQQKEIEDLRLEIKMLKK